MKNADSPANPTIYADMAANGQREIYCDQVGLTKREMFAMHAPECPRWFENEFIDKFKDTEFVVSREHLHESYSNLFGDSSYTLVNRSLTSLGQMQLLKQWRYAYADLMLGEDE